MKICPKCKAEYRDDIAECSDCHVPLVNPEIQKEYITFMNPVKVASVADAVQAEILIEMLKDIGIRAIRRSVASGDYMNVLMGYSVFGEDVYVDESDSEEAAMVVKCFEGENDYAAEEDDYAAEEDAYAAREDAYAAEEDESPESGAEELRGLASYSNRRSIMRMIALLILISAGLLLIFRAIGLVLLFI